MSFINSRKSRVGAVLATAAVSLGLVAGPAAAQGPVVTGGLVNVTIVDAVDVNNNDVNVQVPVSAAANICNVSVAVLVADLQDGDANCTATATSKARR